MVYFNGVSKPSWGHKKTSQKRPATAEQAQLPCCPRRAPGIQADE